MAEPARAFTGNMQVREFLTFLKSRPKEERWQLVEGVAVMMNPPRLRHQQIALNLRDLLKAALETKGLNYLVMNEMGVRVRGVAHFLPRPDVVVIPGIMGDEVYAERFFLAAEVLSPSNTKSLVAQKVRRYKEHPDNLYCLVIDSRRAWMEIHPRARCWEPVELADGDDVLELPDFGLRCTLRDLYRHTPIDPGLSKSA